MLHCWLAIIINTYFSLVQSLGEVTYKEKVRKNNSVLLVCPNAHLGNTNGSSAIRFEKEKRETFCITVGCGFWS